MTATIHHLPVIPRPATIHHLPVIPRPATRPQSNRDAIRSWFASYGATAEQVASLLPPVTTAEQAAYLQQIAQP